MAQTKAHEVTIGIDDEEKKYTIQRFRGLKAIMAMAVMTRIAREVPDLLADAVKEYQRRNTVIITEPMARMPRWDHFTVEDFDKVEAKTGRREIELPTPMTANEQFMYALPKLLEQARKEVIRLLALLVIPNKELREADENDSVEKALDEYKDLLLYEAELDQLVNLCLTAQEVLADQLNERKDELGNLMRSLWNTFRRSQGQTEASQNSLPPTTEPESTSQTLSEDAPTSSTDSEGPTDGTEPLPSMASPGMN